MQPVPDTFAATRQALHRLAEAEISPARQAVTGRIGLRALPGGFGTPVFGDRRRLRVDGAELVVEDAGRETRRPLDVDPDAVRVLADYYAFATSVLEELARDPERKPSMVQLWPEHFDVAVELGDEGSGRRATYGASPGDDDHPEPYLYVSPWSAQEGELWNATAFPGAELPYAELLSAEDPYDAALAFFRDRLL